MTKTFDAVLQALRPGVDYSNPDGTLANVKWSPGVSAPTQQEFDARSVKMETPITVTPLQIRMALRRLGLLDQVNAFVAAQSPDMQDAWQYADFIPITNPMVVAVADAVKADLDALFKLAATLP